ncbi:G-type lectin S-receptor-like serine/threonine-protein kinase At4g27290 isoform X2 [Bidens hawaiensis]|uniref:G-type lectin S-receptor-like serine/threonine-protein kinase At4g27290 isoform X2 n=1 Tax=Bidens hawaiensis TaxID=980011 RepID=UPI00404ABDDC
MAGAATLMFSLLFLYRSYAAELDTISVSKFLTDADTLVSATGIFELGFFQPGSSENRYLGIWYKNISVITVVWVANRDRPLLGGSLPELKFSDQGTLGLFNNSSMIWSSNTTTSGNATAKLRDNGNLVLIDQQEKVLWQSFDYPTDTLLPGMKLGRNYLKGKEWHLSSWKSSEDPARGELTWGPDTVGYPESKLKQGAAIHFRGGPWRNRRFSGISVFSKNLTFRYDVIVNQSEVSFAYNLEDNSILSRVTLNASAHLESWAWVDDSRGWQQAVSFPRDACDKYNMCNAYGICSLNQVQQSCSCLDEKRFVPENQKGWGTADWSAGCIRRTPLECKAGSEGFIKYSNVKLPDTKNTQFNMSMNIEECQRECLKNCTCMAYTNPDPSLGGRGCLLWFDDLLDIRLLPEGSGAGGDIFIRMASSELDSKSTLKNQGGANTKVIIPVIIGGVLLIGFISTWLCYSRRKRNPARPTKEEEIMNASKSQAEDMELPLFSFSTIANATANFSVDNKLGEGGFGSVHKGMLEDGKVIAVKRLSKNSRQGVDEFKNEVICISKLQHRNLVKLLGYCIKGDEKLLIYEYMPNKSLDYFIFDKIQSALLDWTKRIKIIKGIARGLVYLHQDSRLRIIHRDLKASNVLLDQDMNPKISDFGLARSFGGNETQANTERVVGTYGYMSPEYALDGLFSIKSDVFSFGVLVLEIVSGKRNRGFIDPENENSLIGHVWSLYNEGRFMELIDAGCVESRHPSEVLRIINVGLLCVQQNAGDRPNMPSVVLMLDGEDELLQPKKPSLFMGTELPVRNYSSNAFTGGCTFTDVDPR